MSIISHQARDSQPFGPAVKPRKRRNSRKANGAQSVLADLDFYPSASPPDNATPNVLVTNPFPEKIHSEEDKAEQSPPLHKSLLVQFQKPAFMDGPKAPRKKTSRLFQLRDHFFQDEVPRVFVPEWICRCAGGDYAAIIYSQLIYWNSRDCFWKPRLKDEFGEERRSWEASYRSIFLQTGIREDKARRAVQRLESRGLIHVVSEHGKPNRLLLPEDAHQALGEAKEFNPGASTRPGTLVRASEVLVTQTGNQAIVLADILRWFEPNQKGNVKTRLKHNGHAIRANTHDELSKETGLGIFQVKRALTGLFRAGLMGRTYRFFAGRRTLCVFPVIEVLNQRLEAALQSEVQRAR